MKNQPTGCLPCPSPRPSLRRLLAPVAAATALGLAGCLTPESGQRLEGAAPPGAPPPTASEAVLERIDSAGYTAPPPSPRLPDRLEIPATYRLMLLDGHLTLVRETDALPVAGSASLRIVTGEIARGELAYQPALLPQELAAELAALRARAAPLDAAVETARALNEESRRFAALLAAAQARLDAEVPAPKGHARTGR